MAAMLQQKKQKKNRRSHCHIGSQANALVDEAVFVQMQKLFWTKMFDDDIMSEQGVIDLTFVRHREIHVTFQAYLVLRFERNL